jgi:hypothetical protein
MQRTNIYLDEDQARALDVMASAQGTTRAALIRSLIDRGLGAGHTGDEAADLDALEQSFGVLDGEEDFVSRGDDERSRHLAKVASLHP